MNPLSVLATIIAGGCLGWLAYLVREFVRDWRTRPRCAVCKQFLDDDPGPLCAACRNWARAYKQQRQQRPVRNVINAWDADRIAQSSHKEDV